MGLLTVTSSNPLFSTSNPPGTIHFLSPDTLISSGLEIIIPTGEMLPQDTNDSIKSETITWPNWYCSFQKVELNSPLLQYKLDLLSIFSIQSSIYCNKDNVMSLLTVNYTKKEASVLGILLYPLYPWSLSLGKPDAVLLEPLFEAYEETNVRRNRRL